MSDTYNGKPIEIRYDEFGDAYWYRSDGYRSPGFADEQEARQALEEGAVSFAIPAENGLIFELKEDWLVTDYSEEKYMKYAYTRAYRAGQRARLEADQRVFDAIMGGGIESQGLANE